MASIDNNVRVSRPLYLAVKGGTKPCYVIAREAGVTPEMLSRIIHRVKPLQLGDPRVLAIAKAVGIPADRAFAKARR